VARRKDVIVGRRKDVIVFVIVLTFLAELARFDNSRNVKMKLPALWWQFDVSRILETSIMMRNQKQTGNVDSKFCWNDRALLPSGKSPPGPSL
jgi:hypothetical protein